MGYNNLAEAMEAIKAAVAAKAAARVAKDKKVQEAKAKVNDAKQREKGAARHKGEGSSYREEQITAYSQKGTEAPKKEVPGGMDNVNFTQGGAIGSQAGKGGNMLNMSKEFKVYGLGLNDQWALADAMGVDETSIVEVDASTTPADEVGARLTVLMATNPGAMLVVGNDHELDWRRSKAVQTVCEAFKGRCYAEEQLLLIKALRDNKKAFESLQDIEEFIADLGFNVEVSEDTEDQLIFSAPYGSTHRITMEGGNISLDGAIIKETVFIFMNTTKKHPISQGLLGLKSPAETFGIMMAALAVASDAQAAHYAIGVLKGFSGILGPKTHEAAQYDAEGLAFKTRDTLGVALLHKSGDKIWASAPGRTKGDLVIAAQELRAQDSDHLIITNNMGDGLFKISMADLESGKNALRIKYDPKTKEVVLNGSNIKGAAKSHAKHGGRVILPVYITSKDPLSQCGQAVMPKDLMDEMLCAKRTLRFGGTKTFEFNQKNLVEFVNLVKDAVPLVDVGDWVMDGSDLYDLQGITQKAELAGASYGRVSKMTFEQVAKGKTLEFTCVVEIEAYDVGEAKGRGSLKAMFNSMEAAGIVATYNGAPANGLVFGDGVIKATARFREKFTELSRGEVSVTTAYEPEGYALIKAMYAGDKHFTFSDGELTITTMDPQGIYGELEVMIESTSVQENVTDAAMTLHQYALIAGCKEGNAWLAATVMPGMRRKVKTLAYLNAISSKTGWRQPDAEVVILGEDALDIDFGVGDIEIMEQFKERYPNGVMLFADAANYVWLKADYVLSVSAEDSLGNTLVGFGEVAARLIRLAAQPGVAKLINIGGLVTRFKIGAKRLAQSKSLNKVFAVRFGVSSKVVASRATGLTVVEIHPYGRIAKALKKSFGTKAIEGKPVYMLRHPMVVGAVMEIRFNKNVSKHTMQVNEMFWRRVTAGDMDGDTINIFPIKNEKWAKAISSHLTQVVPGYDMNPVLLGVSSESESMEMFGEKLNTSKTCDDMINKVKTMSLAEFISTVEGGARAATWHTGTSYRILEGNAIRYALGLGGVRGLFLGAFLYEHRGLCGKPVVAWTKAAFERTTGKKAPEQMEAATEKALNLWVRGPRDNEMLQDMWGSFGAMLHEVPGYVNQGDTQLPKDLLVTSEMNRLMREGGFKESSKVLGAGWCEYNDLYAIHALAWKLGRRQLAGATDLAAQVMGMNDIAEAYGFKGSFLFQTLKLVSQYIGAIHSKMGGLVSEDEGGAEDIAF